MITLTSNHEPQEQIAAALASRGSVPVTEETKPAVETPPEQPAVEAGGESVVADAAAAPVSETEKAQEPQAQEKEPPPSRGKFKSKLVHSQEREARLADDLEAERREKSNLSRRVEELEAKLKPVEVKSEALVEPVRPKLSDVEFDPDRHEAALAKHDVDMAGYNAKMTAKLIADALAADKAQQQQAREQQESDQRNKEFKDRVLTVASAYEDWDEVFDSLGSSTEVKSSKAIEDALILSENPGDLLYFMARDVLENEGKEIQRITGLLPAAQIAAITRLEMRLVKEREDRAKPAAPAVAVTPEKTEAPVKRQPAAAPAKAPITPVGSRGGHTPTLKDAEGQGVRAYAKLRSQGVNVA